MQRFERNAKGILREVAGRSPLSSEDLCPSVPRVSLIDAHFKYEQVLEQLLAQWKQDGDKVLIFSMNLRLLDFIENFLGLAGESPAGNSRTLDLLLTLPLFVRVGQTFRRLDGRVPQERSKSIPPLPDVPFAAQIILTIK